MFTQSVIKKALSAAEMHNMSANVVIDEELAMERIESGSNVDLVRVSASASSDAVLAADAPISDDEVRQLLGGGKFKSEVRRNMSAKLTKAIIDDSLFPFMEAVSAVGWSTAFAITMRAFEISPVIPMMIGSSIVMMQLILRLAADRRAEPADGSKDLLKEANRIITSFNNSGNTYSFGLQLWIAIYIAGYEIVNGLSDKQVDDSTLQFYLIFVVPFALIALTHGGLDIAKDKIKNSETLKSIYGFLVGLNMASTLNSAMINTLEAFNLKVTEQGDINPLVRVGLFAVPTALGFAASKIKFSDDHKKLIAQALIFFSTVSYGLQLFANPGRKQYDTTATTIMAVMFALSATVALGTNMFFPITEKNVSDENRSTRRYT